MARVLDTNHREMRIGLVLRHALRGLRGRPAFTILNAAVLAVGIAGVTTIAGLVGGLLLRPLPYAHAERLVLVLGGDRAGGGAQTLSGAQLALLREQARSFERLAALADDPAVVGRDADARLGRGLRVAGDLGATLGAGLRVGRPLPEDAGDAGAVVLGHSFWRDRLDGREDVVGRTLFLDGRPATVAGVLATSARLKPVLGFEPDWWRPLTAEDARDGPSRALALARLRRGVDAAAAEAELAVLSRRLAAGGGDADRSLRVTPLRAGVDPVARVLVMLVLAAILGIVCLDVGSVLLAGALAREREIAVRLALGAGRGVVAAQLLLEGLLLGLLGGAVGWGLTRAAARALAALSAGTNAEALAIDFDGWLQGTALVVSLAAGLLAGVAPALHARRVRCAVLLNEGVAPASGTPRARRLRALLVAGQVALSLTLLTQAGLALSSLDGCSPWIAASPRRACSPCRSRAEGRTARCRSAWPARRASAPWPSRARCPRAARSRRTASWAPGAKAAAPAWPT